MSTMFSYELVADGNYHTVEILAIKKNFTLRVDGGLARSIVNEGPNEFLNVHTPLYLAGVPQETGTKAWKQWHLRNTTSFIGKDKPMYICWFVMCRLSRKEQDSYCNVQNVQDKQAFVQW